MISEEQILKLVKEKLQETDNFIVDVKVNTGNKIIVEIDNDKGISIEDCVKVSRFLEDNLDREKEDFELQVSSPGLNKPFKILRQYIKNIGRNVEVVMSNGEKLEGKLLSANEEAVVLELEKKVKDEKTKKKKTIKEAVKIDFDQIKETKIIISFK
jgi:ribosome maturation factor RimP